MHSTGTIPTATCRRIEVSSEQLSSVRTLYEQGLTVQAYRLAIESGPLDRWTGTAARVLAGRLAMNLGAPVLGRRLQLWAYHRDPLDPEARFYHALTVSQMRGPLAGWKLLESFGEMCEAPAELRADLFGVRCHNAAGVRDFETAASWLARAVALAPGKAWIQLQRAFLLEMQDRYEEALAAAREALNLHPHPYYRPAVQTAAHLLELLDRDSDALDLLQAASQQIESGPVVGQLAALQSELELHAEARVTWDRYWSLSPLLEPAAQEWLTGQHARLAYRCGDFQAALEFARQLKDPFHEQFAADLAQAPAAGKPVRLGVRFVRQHHKTCAPATLAAIGSFWDRPSDHLQLAETICYDGTPGHKQRAWAEENGWVVREFRLTWESAVALLDRGVPFTVTTVETASAHLQAVIGYDSLRRSFIIRDPYQRHAGEVLVEKFLKHYRSSGPHAMALAPAERRDLLESLDLPDADLYDRVYRLQRALSGHDRDEAQRALAELMAKAPEHPLAWHARRELADYDGNALETLASIEGLLSLFPQDANLRLSKLACLRDGRREDRLAFLDAICLDKDADALFWQQYAAELSADAREQDRALRLLRRSMRFRPVDAVSFTLLADLLWQGRRFAEATEIYRLAACLEEAKEQPARTYFIAARHLRQTEQALMQLQRRFQSLGRRSAGPATTLVWAYQALDRSHDAFACLESALKLKSDDGELLCFAADEYARWGDLAHAESLLAAAQGKTRPGMWIRTAAQMARYRGDLTGSLVLWRQLLDLEPLALDAQRAAVCLIAETEGRAAALQHLQGACDQFPHHYGLHQLWIEWLRTEPAPDAESAVRRLLAIHPSDAWARRELAWCFSRQNRFEEALAEADFAIGLDPHHPSCFSMRGNIYLEAGKLAEARDDFRHAIRLAVDTEYAIRRLVELGTNHEERRQDLVFIEEELIRQVVFGDGLLTFREMAHPVLEPGQLLTSLRLAHQERPDLWHAWSALINQLTDMNQLDEALEWAQQASERFPLMPRLWSDLARVHHARLDRARQIAALEKALEINPAWSYAARELAEAVERQGDSCRARTLLEQAAARSPLDEFNHGCLADLLWRVGEKQAAVDRVQLALQLSSGYDWAWGALAKWARELGRPNLVVQIARDLTVSRPGEALSWVRLAEALSAPEDSGERLAALDRALTLSPRWVAAHELRAETLANLQQYDEALAACAGEVWSGSVPVQLRAKAAQIEAQRGHVPEAIRQMRAALETDPDYYSGWSQLAEWCWNDGQLDEAANAASIMARLAPLNPVPLGYLGDLKLKNGARTEAKQHFQRAVELGPEYAFAGYSLFDLHLEDGALEEAAQTLARLRLPPGQPLFLAREVQLLARRGEKERAVAELGHLCAMPAADRWSLQAAADALAGAGWKTEAEHCLEQALAFPEANPQLGAVWVSQRLARERWWALRKLSTFISRGALGKHAMAEYLEKLGEHAQRALRKRAILAIIKDRIILRLLFRKHRKVLGADDDLWAKAGYVLISLGKHREAIDWLGDWRQRQKLEMWMLHNLALALRQRGMEALAVEVVRHALTLPERDGTFPNLTLWASLELALIGNTQAAEEHLSAVPRKELAEEEQLTLRLVQAVLAVQKAPVPDRKQAFAIACTDLRAAFRDIPLPHPKKTLARTYRRCMRRITQDAFKRCPVFWTWWQWARTFLRTGCRK